MFDWFSTVNEVKQKKREMKRFLMLGMDHFILTGGSGGGGVGGWAITKKDLCTAKVQKKNYAQGAIGFGRLC